MEKTGGTVLGPGAAWSGSASGLWNHFVRRPGAAVDGEVGIASMHAIGGLLRLIRRKRPARVLEIGSGIGTLTYAIAASQSRDVPERGRIFYTVENHPFCIAEMEKNLAGLDELYTRVGSVGEIPGDLRFDLIVVDGGGDLPNDMGVMRFADRLAKGGVIFVEGGRGFQREQIEKWYGHRPRLYAKMQSFRAVVPVPDLGWQVNNKPYHVFVFEPGRLESAVMRARGFLNRFGVSVYRRVRAVIGGSDGVGG
jgi:protein-L-isoaspartate O-methyltransferase